MAAQSCCWLEDNSCSCQGGMWACSMWCMAMEPFCTGLLMQASKLPLLSSQAGRWFGRAGCPLRCCLRCHAGCKACRSCGEVWLLCLLCMFRLASTSGASGFTPHSTQCSRIAACCCCCCCSKQRPKHNQTRSVLHEVSCTLPSRRPATAAVQAVQLLAASGSSCQRIIS